MKRFSLIENGMLIRQASVKLQKLYGMNGIESLDLDVIMVTDTHDSDAKIK